MTKPKTPTQILAHKRALKAAQQSRYTTRLNARAKVSKDLLASVQELREILMHNLDARTMRACQAHLERAERAMQAAMEAGVAS